MIRLFTFATLLSVAINYLARATEPDLNAAFLVMREKLDARLNQLNENAVPISGEINLSFGPHERKHGETEVYFWFKGAAPSPHIARFLTQTTSETFITADDGVKSINTLNYFESLVPTSVDMSTGYDGYSRLIGASVISEMSRNGEIRSLSVAFPKDKTDENWTPDKLSELSPLVPRFQFTTAKATQGQTVLESTVAPQGQDEFAETPPTLEGTIACARSKCLLILIDENMFGGSGDVDATLTAKGYVLLEMPSLRVHESTIHISTFANHEKPVTLNVITNYRTLN